MARIRTIKPEFWKHEELSELPPETHLLAAALLNYADDEGYFNANPKLIIAECCPLRDLSMSIQGSIKKLQSIGYIRIGSNGDGRKYGHIISFLVHQFINRPKPSKIKELKIVWEDAVTDHGGIHDDTLLEGKGKERKGRERNYIDHFGDFWKAVPKKIGKKKAYNIYKSVVTKGEATEEQLVAAMQVYAASVDGGDPKYFCHPVTWLNQGRWEDEITVSKFEETKKRLKEGTL